MDVKESVQELVQESVEEVVDNITDKQFSFEEICPDWAQILADNGGYIETKNKSFKSDDGKERSIMQCSSCLVGEAHG
jgi:hypothetical protein